MTFTEQFLLQACTNPRHNLDFHVENSLMFVAGFTPAIGYERDIPIACVAFVDAIGLREACLKLVS